MRDIMNKRTGEEQILRAARLAGEGGIPKVKLYFMLGLPGEIESDVDELIALCKAVLSETRATIGGRGWRSVCRRTCRRPRLRSSGRPMAEAVVSGRIQRIQRALRPLGIEVRNENPALSRVQAVLARGDRRVAMALLQTRGLKDWESALGRGWVRPERYVGALDPMKDLLPWSVVSTTCRTGICVASSIRPGA